MKMSTNHGHGPGLLVRPLLLICVELKGFKHRYTYPLEGPRSHVAVSCRGPGCLAVRHVIKQLTLENREREDADSHPDVSFKVVRFH